MAVKTRYGWAEIDGIRYDHDIIIHADRNVTKRSRKEAKKYKKKFGHTPLIVKELAFVAEEDPAPVFIGTGQCGGLPVTGEAKELLEPYTPDIRTTPEIFELIAEETRLFVAVLHVNC